MAVAEVRRVLTFGAPADTILDTWQVPDVQRRVLAHLVQAADDDAHGATLAGAPPEWPVDAIERVGDGCRWRIHTERGEHAGTLAVRPAPNDLGTEVTLAVQSPADGALADGVTSAAVFEALHRFKSLVETGEIPTLDHNPHARHSGPDPH